MHSFIILSVLGLFTVYGLANAVFAFKNPSGWLRASWTATRGFDLNGDPPPTKGDVRTMGVFLLFFACVAGFLAIKYILAI